MYVCIYIYIYTHTHTYCCSRDQPRQQLDRSCVWRFLLCISLNLFTLLDLCVSSLRRGHANLLCISPILTDDPRRESSFYFVYHIGCIHVCVCVSLSLSTYIHIIHIYLSIYLSLSIYIYMYIHTRL